MIGELELEGVRQNNLKDVSLKLPLGKAIVITGPSGSGKSSLAFETLYAEGQRRYMQSLSTYARQFLERFSAPDADAIRNIPPTIALEQLNPVRNSRATVGTSTEIYDYLRLLFEKVGQQYCDKCDIPMQRLSYTDILDQLTTGHGGHTVIFGAGKKLARKKDDASHELADLMRSGYTRVVWQDEVHTLDTEKPLAGMSGAKVSVVVDRLKLPKSDVPDESFLTRATEALKTAMDLGGGDAEVYLEGENRKYTWLADYTTECRCPKCGAKAPPKTATSFSFNSPLGACQTCKGFGNILEVDESLVVPNPALSLARGAVDPFTKPSLKHWQKKMMAFAAKARLDVDLPYRDLPEEHRKWIFEGTEGFVGVRGVFAELNEEKYKMRIRVFVSRYNSAFTCPTCKGARLNSAALRVKIGGKSIYEVTRLTLGDTLTFLRGLDWKKREKEISKDVLTQLDRRLDYLITVGLAYLTLDRLTRSLSGGEYQRILLATQLSQGLTDTMYVLDEPSIGLHPKDTNQLLKVLDRLRGLGNTLVLVEHDPEVILWGEYIVDMGPGSGSRGGEIMFTGSRERFLLSNCRTAEAVRDWKALCKKNASRGLSPTQDRWLEIKGASENNLKNVEVSIPLNHLVAITGVSGSGKSTLIVDTLFQALTKIFQGRSEKIGRFESISGFEHLGGIELVDQTAIGRSSRSNPITFVKGYDEVRALFASTPEAAKKKLTPGHFSFNVPGGRCETCEGEGRVRIDMVFMEEVWVPCETCDQKRFKPSVLAVRYRGRNISEVLDLTIDEAFDFFEGTPSLRAKLALLREVGLGYLQLGQPGFTLSGGESQRLKIARELSAGGVKRLPTLFILDEPTTGLHFHEIDRLIGVFRRLVGAGHSVIVIEHNLQMICAANYLIDLGPDGGEGGGTVVAVGTPTELATKRLPHTGLYLAEILL